MKAFQIWDSSTSVAVAEAGYGWDRENPEYEVLSVKTDLFSILQVAKNISLRKERSSSYKQL